MNYKQQIGNAGFKSLFIAAVMLLVLQTTPNAQNGKRNDGERKSRTEQNYTERDEFHQTYQLAPGANVELSVIYGPTVEIETVNSNQAEVHIVRLARHREDFNYRKINIEHTANSLIIRGERQDTNRDVQVPQRVILKLPRQISLKVNNIYAPLRIGEIEGAVKIDNIFGPVTIAQAADCVTAEQISGPLTVTIDKLDACGVRVDHISGPVTLRFKNELNADVSVSEANGQISFGLANATILQKAIGSVTAKTGTGGIPVKITNVNGGVQFLTALSTTNR